MKKQLSGHYRFFLTFILGSTFIFLSGCGSRVNANKGSAAYIASINQWHKKRIKNLKKEDGWLNLAGLYWLKDGINKIGSANDNDIVFPAEAPKHIGSISLNKGVTTISVLPGVPVSSNGKPVTEVRLYNDEDGTPTVLAVGSLRWFVIKRSDKYGIRLRDLNAPLVKNFKDIDMFPINEDWKINAKYVRYNPPKIISVASVINTSEEDTLHGYVEFDVKGKKYKLNPIEEGNQLFIIFADETSGEETYGAGRFLYADKPDSSGTVVLDFNEAYNPPCAFTPYATCPLPPKQNYLRLRITAGEKAYAEGHS